MERRGREQDSQSYPRGLVHALRRATGRIDAGVPGSLVGDCVGDPADEPQRLEICDLIH